MYSGCSPHTVVVSLNPAHGTKPSIPLPSLPISYHHHISQGVSQNTRMTTANYCSYILSVYSHPDMQIINHLTTNKSASTTLLLENVDVFDPGISALTINN